MHQRYRKISRLAMQVASAAFSAIAPGITFVSCCLPQRRGGEWSGVMRSHSGPFLSVQQPASSRCAECALGGRDLTIAERQRPSWKRARDRIQAVMDVGRRKRTVDAAMKRAGLRKTMTRARRCPCGHGRRRPSAVSSEVVILGEMGRRIIGGQPRFSSCGEGM